MEKTKVFVVTSTFMMGCFPSSPSVIGFTTNELEAKYYVKQKKNGTTSYVYNYIEVETLDTIHTDTKDYKKFIKEEVEITERKITSLENAQTNGDTMLNKHRAELLTLKELLD